MEYSSCWESNCSLSSQELTRLLWNPMVHCRAHKHQPLIYPDSYRSSPHLRILMLKVRFNIVPSTTPSSSKLYLSFKTLTAFVFSPTRATCPAHLIALYVILLLIFGNECKHEVPRDAFFSSIILLPPSWIWVICPTHCARRYSVHVFQLIWETKVSHPFKTTRRIIYIYIYIYIHIVQNISNRKLGSLPRMKPPVIFLANAACRFRILEPCHIFQWIY
jgi:hypothetical protein